ncbi:zinc-binding alcohol dehydrogenase family protein [Brucella sp. BE17]|uniref:zinc-binding alcohol dehydrogenase family protein n=1 Tax=Brucella sp. BE17 TaxID=3142977 RepID=UPI0031BA1979
MKAVAYQVPGAIVREEALVDVTLDDPKPSGRDILVRVEAVSVNPVDYKIRGGVAPEKEPWKVLGWDAVGTVAATGEAVTKFRPGDRVWYAGSIIRPGTNSELHLVDERIASLAPTALSNAQAAALPLTAITAWEALFDRLDVRKTVPGASHSILIIGGAGGVGSIAIQLLRALTDLTVIATASRPETQDWVTELGAHHVIDHSKPLAAQIEALGIGAPAFVFSTTQTLGHLEEVVKLIAPQGRFSLIDDPEVLDVMPFKRKSVSVHWELMFTRAIFETQDMDEQGKLLNRVAQLAEEGKIKSTLTEILSPINAANLKKAHGVLESGKAKGKIVLEGW